MTLLVNLQYGFVSMEGGDAGRRPSFLVFGVDVDLGGESGADLGVWMRLAFYGHT